MKVLMILNHAPDYRESFLRELGGKIDLTVVAQPCAPDGLTPPESREGYRYIEIDSVKFFGLLWQPGLGRLLRGKKWDVICVSANLRHLSRIFLFLANPGYRDKWVWWGHIFGRSELKILSILRTYIIRKSAFCLVHGKSIAIQLNGEHGAKVVSFNNTEIRKSEFRSGKFKKNPNLQLLFVGRYQPRKKLERLVELAKRREDVQVRLIGPGMENLSIPADLLTLGRIELFGRTVGEELNFHFDWADLVANPGHIGLLVMNAARHGKGVVVDSGSEHAPEFYLAKEAEQPFISFGDSEEVNRFIARVHENPSLLRQWGNALQARAKKEYTIESMTEVHVKVFKAVTTDQKITT